MCKISHDYKLVSCVCANCLFCLVKLPGCSITGLCWEWLAMVRRPLCFLYEVATGSSSCAHQFFLCNLVSACFNSGPCKNIFNIPFMCAMGYNAWGTFWEADWALDENWFRMQPCPLSQRNCLINLTEHLTQLVINESYNREAILLKWKGCM